MIFGKTYEQKHKEKQAYLDSIKCGYIWFAWRPVTENNGEILWLEKVKVSHLIYEAHGVLELSDNKPIYYKIK